MSIGTSNSVLPGSTGIASGPLPALDQCNCSVSSFRNLLIEVKDPSSGSASDGAVVLKLNRNDFSHLGTITLSNLSCDQIEGFISKVWQILDGQPNPTEGSLSSAQLIAILNETFEFNFHSTLGDARDAVVLGYEQLRERTEAQRMEACLEVLQVSPTEGRATLVTDASTDPAIQDGFRWYILKNPDATTLARLAKELQLDTDFIVASSTPTANLRTSEGVGPNGESYLSITVGEVRSPLGAPEQLAVHPLCCAIGKGYLVTVTHGDSEALNRVRHELLDGNKKICSKLRSNNYLFCRILGSLIHHAEDVLNAAEAKADKLVQNAAIQWGSSVAEELASALDRAMILASRFVTPIPAIVRSLQQGEYLFMANDPAAHPRLATYLAIADSLHPDIEQIRAQIDLTRKEWQALEQKAQTVEERSQTSVGLKLAVLGALVVPITTVLGYWGVELAEKPLPESWFLPSVGVAILSSAGLLWGVRGAFRSFLDRKP